MRKMLVVIFLVALTCNRGRAEEPEVSKEQKKEQVVLEKSLSTDIYGRPDPFAPVTARTTSPSRKENLGLEGIIWDESQPLAIINGLIVSEGEMLDGKKVLKIEDDKVILEEGGKETVLEL